MPGIFISYRRIDAIAWAGRLFADLRDSFGASQVFMDINGGIPRGADFEQVLTTALGSCDALLALVGPQWVSCTRSDNPPVAKTILIKIRKKPSPLQFDPHSGSASGSHSW